jgi:ABC-2 type transport system permease protein
MNNDASADANTAAMPAAAHATRPLYWSLRRELWENRAIYVAPAAVAGLMLFATIGGAIYYGGKIVETMRPVLEMEPVRRAASLGESQAFAAMLILLTAFLVGFFYSLDALYGERRDRSILFWKSLPVSDFTTVLSKALVPLAVLPLITLAVIVATQLVMLLVSMIAMATHGLDAGMLWSSVPFVQNAFVLLYGLVTLALWHAPIYGWLFLVSGWARRAAFLWAVLPPLALCIVEAITFHSSYFGRMLKQRLVGDPAQVIDFKHFDSRHGVTPVIIPPSDIDLGAFFGSAGLWIGLVIAIVFFAAAIQMRRKREPL